MFPHGDISGAEWLLPLVIFGIAGADIALAALAYRHDVGSTVHVRAIVEPWVISIAAGAARLHAISARDGLIIAYVVSVVAGPGRGRCGGCSAATALPARLEAASGALMAVARRNIPLAAADAIEWGSRRLDIAILGLFVAPYYVGLYYVAPAGRLDAAEAEDQLRPDPRPGHHPEARRGRQGGGGASRSGRSASGSSPPRPGSRSRSAYRARR